MQPCAAESSLLTGSWGLSVILGPGISDLRSAARQCGPFGHGSATTIRHGSWQASECDSGQGSPQSDSVDACINCLPGINPDNSLSSVDALVSISWGARSSRADATRPKYA